MNAFMSAALGIVIRTSVLLACVSALSLSLRRASASVRHALWVVGLLAVLVFPLASRVLPKWDWVILPANAPSATAFDTTPAPAPAPDAVIISSNSVLSPSVRSAPKTTAVVLSAAASRQNWSWGDWIALAWALGSSLFVFGWLKSIWDLHLLTLQSKPLTEDGWCEVLANVQHEIGVEGSVRLRVATQPIPPMTWGIFRHVILLPAAAIDWFPARQRLVLAHEMAHVKRNDGIGQMLAQAVSAIYWFNPLVWYAVRRLHAERERACDDCVLRLGADGADYADHLLQITRGLNSAFAQSAVSMAHPSQLKARVIAILDSSVRRSRASRIAATILLTTVGVLTLSIAAVQLTALSTMALPAFAKPLGVPLWSAEPASVQRTSAQVPAPQPAATAIDPQRAFLDQYCVTCHNADDRIGSVVFVGSNTRVPRSAYNSYRYQAFPSGVADLASIDNDRLGWEKVVRRLRAGMDPPPFSNVPRPSQATINSMIQFLEGQLDRDAKTYIPPIGPHRLNRTEYANAIRDLLDLETDFSKLLPRDDSTSGFDNIVAALGTSPRSTEAYVAIAPIVSRMAIQTSSTSPSYKRIFLCGPTTYHEKDSDADCGRKIVTALVENALRGFATKADIDGFMPPGIFGNEYEIEKVLAQILASPKFLYRTEEAPANVAAGEAYRISDLALASRLSFFLWSTSPDQELIDLAKQGKLHDPAVLESQTLRMLKDYRADALTTNFAGQWLGLRYMQNAEPSPSLFPDFDESMRQAMRQESEMLFDSVVREDHNVVDLLTADYTFVNNRLARYYGIPNVTGSQFRRVTLSDALDVRRGILGKAAFLTFTSRTNRTSPVTRAKWIMGSLLGTPPPDPPPNVLPLNERDAVEHGMRTTLEAAYRDAPTNLYTNTNACITCHRLIDPMGYALENFNPIGQWRDAEGGAPINASDSLFDGTKVNGPADLRRWLVVHSDQFVQTMTVRLMTYALGRGVEPQDMPLIRAIDRDAARNNNRFSALVLGIVKSDTFQMNSK
jgi:beta-lactamase regulating signal transducer with metallopeptidase domain